MPGPVSTLNTERVSKLMTVGCREFHVAGAVQLSDRLLMSVCLKGTSRNGTVLAGQTQVNLEKLWRNRLVKQKPKL